MINHPTFFWWRKWCSGRNDSMTKQKQNEANNELKARKKFSFRIRYEPDCDSYTEHQFCSEASYHRVSSTLEKLRLMGFNPFIFCKSLLNPQCLYFWPTCEVDKKTTMLFYYFLNHLKSYWGLRDKNIYLVPRLLKFFPNSNIYSCLKKWQNWKRKGILCGQN